MNSHKYISNLSLHVSEHSSDLTAMERDMIQKLIKERHQFTYKSFTIANIAETLNVSSTSLHRLSQKLGYPSFALLKEDYFTRPQEVKDGIEQNDLESAISTTCRLVEQELTSDMLNTILFAKRVTIYGMGISSMIAKIYQNKLSLFGIPTQEYNDSRFMRISANALRQEEDAIIILSRSGRPPELIEVLLEANNRNVSSILITEAQGSPLENMATYVLHTAYAQDLDDNIDTRIHTHIAMDMLIDRVIQMKQKGDMK